MGLDFSIKDVLEIVEDMEGVSSKDLLPEGRVRGLGGVVAIRAAQKGHVATLRFLADQGVDLSAEVIGNGIPGWRPIETAAANDRKEAVFFLATLDSEHFVNSLEGCVEEGCVVPKLGLLGLAKHFPDLQADMRDLATRLKKERPNTQRRNVNAFDI